MKNVLIGQKIHFNVKIHITSIQSNVSLGCLTIGSNGFNFRTVFLRECAIYELYRISMIALLRFGIEFASC